ncbi:hypothetical protein BV898_01388 [Hypsibius exemplaris]|uniref:Uncharacterized protein n=1 Tax=Hypsibius exemplaris TaxID=2072580 RepID=A0A1W0XBA9_HYPEX|nr:hypothetical protein BV898_01388 [Hypsibius exemplaris]
MSIQYPRRSRSTSSGGLTAGSLPNGKQIGQSMKLCPLQLFPAAATLYFLGPNIKSTACQDEDLGYSQTLECYSDLKCFRFSSNAPWDFVQWGVYRPEMTKAEIAQSNADLPTMQASKEGCPL